MENISDKAGFGQRPGGSEGLSQAIPGGIACQAAGTASANAPR